MERCTRIPDTARTTPSCGRRGGCQRGYQVGTWARPHAQRRVQQRQLLASYHRMARPKQNRGHRWRHQPRCGGTQHGRMRASTGAVHHCSHHLRYQCLLSQSPEKTPQPGCHCCCHRGWTPGRTLPARRRCSAPHGDRLLIRRARRPPVEAAASARGQWHRAASLGCRWRSYSPR